MCILVLICGVCGLCVCFCVHSCGVMGSFSVNVFAWVWVFFLWHVGFVCVFSVFVCLFMCGVSEGFLLLWFL